MLYRGLNTELDTHGLIREKKKKPDPALKKLAVRVMGQAYK